MKIWNGKIVVCFVVAKLEKEKFASGIFFIRFFVVIVFCPLNNRRKDTFTLGGRVNIQHRYNNKTTATYRTHTEKKPSKQRRRKNWKNEENIKKKVTLAKKWFYWFIFFYEKCMNSVCVVFFGKYIKM